MTLGSAHDAGAERLLSPDSSVRRHFEELADNLLSLGERPLSVVVTGPEPGAGCSSVCLGVSGALAATGRRAAVVDCNLRNPGLHRMLGEPNFLGLTTSLGGNRALEHYGFEAVPGVFAVPTGPVPADPDAPLRSERFVEAVRGLGEGRDLVLLDAPAAGRMLDTPTLSGGFDGVLLVVHATQTSKNTAREVTEDLLDAGVNLLGVVLNGFTNGTS
ncbi:MAG: CpsD/CapB family tyrosine-protein kinase [Rubrobacter sp.]|nr:CpsD/CapB family tyrosine-protein kinase [Rubrobacter sp.]